ncbi:MAG: N-methylhydantoinase B [Gammaproteobacteria bacterium]|jgi:N-methylhydantoinase B
MSTATKAKEMDASAGGPIDPVTFEVMRHRLWAINDEQAMMAARVSGSPVVYEAYDFNSGILTGDGRGLFVGVYIVHHAVPLDIMVRTVLEQWELDDIREGDMFFSNDPWAGALHANDGIMVSPIFWNGEIVAWTGIVMHDSDVGSPVPGSFVVGATDRFGEAPLFPPVKMVENFKIRADLERAFLRNSRTEALNALNMRARVAALSKTHQRIHELITQYGIDTFLACQEEIIDYVDRIVRQRVREIPDGSWFEQAYIDHDGNNNELYPMCVRLTKSGDRVTLDFTGTAPQAPGSINCTRAGLEGGAFGVFLLFLCYDIPWSVGALRQVIDIISEEGTLNNATSPAAVSMGSVMGTWVTQNVVSNVAAKMLMSSTAFRGEAQACWQPSLNGQVIAGMDRRGDPFASILMDCCGGGAGARTFADGIDTGGFMQSMSASIPNVETTESRYPVLQVYRRQRCDSGGPGRYRGGVSIEYGLIPHKSPGPIADVVFTSGASQPEGHGLSGGGPASLALNMVLRGSNVREMYAAGEIPCSADEIKAEVREVLSAKDQTMLADGDCHICLQTGGGGYGDPLSRDMQAVELDVRRGLVSADAAFSIYGVVVKDDVLNADASKIERARAVTQRLADSSPVLPAQLVDPTSAANPEPATYLHPVADTLEAVRLGGRDVVRCTICATTLSSYEQDYKRGTNMRELPISAMSPLNGHNTLEDIVLREFLCPTCGTSIAIDVQRKAEPILDEARFGDRR